MLSSIYSWQFASVALIIFAVCSVFVRNKKVQSYITEKNIGVIQRWDVQYLAGLPSLVVEKPIDCSIIIDNDDNLIILAGKLEEKIPLRNINTVTVATKKTLGIGKMFKINYTNTSGEKVDIVFKSLNSPTITEAIMDSKNRLSTEKQGCCQEKFTK
jgi:hypothetical protein